MRLIYQGLEQLCADALPLIGRKQFKVAQENVGCSSHDAEYTDVLSVEHNDLASQWAKVLPEVLCLPRFVPLSPRLRDIHLHRCTVQAIEEIGVIRCGGSQCNIHAGLSRVTRPTVAQASLAIRRNSY